MAGSGTRGDRPDRRGRAPAPPRRRAAISVLAVTDPAHDEAPGPAPGQCGDLAGIELQLHLVARTDLAELVVVVAEQPSDLAEPGQPARHAGQRRGIDLVVVIEK